LVRFDVLNEGPLSAVVWITTDAGADMQGVPPGGRVTIEVPLLDRAQVDVFGTDDCNELAEPIRLPSASSSTITLKVNPDGGGYLVSVEAGVSGPAKSKSPYLYGSCSGEDRRIPGG
jgi:hypothetical protein